MSRSAAVDPATNVSPPLRSSFQTAKAIRDHRTTSKVRSSPSSPKVLLTLRSRDGDGLDIRVAKIGKLRTR